MDYTNFIKLNKEVHYQNNGDIGFLIVLDNKAVNPELTALENVICYFNLHGLNVGIEFELYEMGTASIRFLRDCSAFGIDFKVKDFYDIDQSPSETTIRLYQDVG